MKDCLRESCSYPRFGGGYCKNHQYMRKDKKPSKLKRKPIKKKIKPTGEKALFDEIFTEREHKSFISDINLEVFVDKLYVNLFAHVIPKNGTPRLKFKNKADVDKYLRLNKANIVLLTPREHMLYDQGTDADRAAYVREVKGVFGKTVNWGKLYDLQEKLIIEIQKEIE